MDTERLANAIRRFAAMREEYGRVGELGDRLREAVKESLIQRFEYTEEIAWKTGKRYLKTVEGYADDAGPKPVYRQLGRLGLLDAETWLTYHQARITTSHDYSGEKAEAILETMDAFHEDAAAYHQQLNERIAQRSAEAEG